LKTALAGTNALGVAAALGNTQHKDIVPLLYPVVTNSTFNVLVRKQAVQALAQVQDGAASLLALTREGKLLDDLKLIAASELNRSRWPEIKAKAAEVLPLPQGKNAEPLPPISELAKLKGDPAKGADVFRRIDVGCIKCHQVNGEGTDFGP